MFKLNRISIVDELALKKHYNKSCFIAWASIEKTLQQIMFYCTTRPLDLNGLCALHAFQCNGIGTFPTKMSEIWGGKDIFIQFFGSWHLHMSYLQWYS